jgi:hypothetical protein
MARRRMHSASLGNPSRFHVTNRRFDESINELTSQSIEQSLHEIGNALLEKYGSIAEKPKAKPAAKKTQK